MDSNAKLALWKQTLLDRKKDEENLRQKYATERDQYNYPTVPSHEWIEPLQKLHAQVSELRKYVKVQPVSILKFL